MQLTDKQFHDWEWHFFGFGYGSGEWPILTALKEWLDMLAEVRSGYPRYYSSQMEDKFGSLAAWLLINVLTHADIIEYGTSTRFGWLTQKGLILREYLAGKTVQELYDVLASDHQDPVCWPSMCQCGAKKGHCNLLF